MFMHESNKWSMAGSNRKITFSLACKKERESIQATLDLRKSLKEREECFLLVSHHVQADIFADDRYSELTVTKDKNDFVVKGFKDFEMKSDDVARIFKALIQSFENHGREVYSIIVCGAHNTTGLYDGQEVYV